MVEKPAGRSCRDCAWCEHAAGLIVGFCWSRAEGPQAVDVRDDERGPESCDFRKIRSQEELPRERWSRVYAASCRQRGIRLEEVLTIMRLSAAGSSRIPEERE